MNEVALSSDPVKKKVILKHCNVLTVTQRSQPLNSVNFKITKVIHKSLNKNSSVIERH